jgi:hypothetical protein
VPGGAGNCVLEGICSYGEKYLTTGVGQWLSYDLRLTIYSHIQRLSLPFHDHESIGDPPKIKQEEHRRAGVRYYFFPPASATLAAAESLRISDSSFCASATSVEVAAKRKYCRMCSADSG